MSAATRRAFLAGVRLADCRAGAPRAGRAEMQIGALRAVLAETAADAAAEARRLARASAVLPGGRRALFAAQSAPALRAAVRDWLTPRAELIEAWLADLGGRSEFVIRLHAAPEPAAAAPAARGYLARRAAEIRRLDAAAAALRGALGQPAGAVAQTAAPGGCDLCVLWPRDDAPGFAARLAPQVRALAPRIAVRASGPWPAYSFAPADPSAGEAPRQAAAGR